MEPTISAKNVLFIKLGESGEWERTCIENGTLRLGYHDVPHNFCVYGNWESARQSFPQEADPGSITRHLNQVQQFYEAPAETLWITFYSNRLWWCFSKPEITQLEDKSKIRQVIGSWRDTDIEEKVLIKGRLSGKLLAVQGFQGTICSVKERDYLIHKINGTFEPHVAEAQGALEKLTLSLIPIIKNLHPKDLETLTDLIFRESGWQRTGVAGETEKDIDLDLMSPITQERIAIQVKSKASASTYNSYQNIFSDMSGYSKFYFVTHSPDLSLELTTSTANDGNFVFWGPLELAQQAARSGLIEWLIDKAS